MSATSIMLVDLVDVSPERGRGTRTVRCPPTTCVVGASDGGDAPRGADPRPRVDAQEGEALRARVTSVTARGDVNRNDVGSGCAVGVGQGTTGTASASDRARDRRCTDRDEDAERARAPIPHWATRREVL